MHFIQGNIKNDDGEEGVSSYWITLRKREGNGSWKRRHSIVLCGELALEDAMYCRNAVYVMNG